MKFILCQGIDMDDKEKDKDANSRLKSKAEECKEEVINAQTPGLKTAEEIRLETNDIKTQDTDR
jgi:hypothetical protein